MGRKKKPLLAEQGIVHLKHSFVQPTQESGLLKTVGGKDERTALILSTGTYGYAIPISTLTKEGDEDSDDSLPEVVNVFESTSDPEVKIVRQVIPENGSGSATGTTKKSKSKKESRSKGKDKKDSSENVKKDKNPDELSVAELVRGIGGGSEAPLRRCDVVDDRKKESENKTDDNNEEESENVQMEDDPEADEFYESLGIHRAKRRKLDNDDAEGASGQIEVGDAPNKEGETETGNGEPFDEEGNKLQSITDYYRDNSSGLYFYSQQHNPLGQHRLEFGPFIDAEDSSEYDQDYIQLARLAQRARAAAQAAAEKRKRSAEDSNQNQTEEEAIYDPLPMEVVTSTKPEELGITVDTNLEQYWDFVKEDPHDFDRWIYLIHYVEHIVSS